MIPGVACDTCGYVATTVEEAEQHQLKDKPDHWGWTPLSQKELE